MKRGLLFIGAVLAVITGTASPLSPDEALKRLQASGPIPGLQTRSFSQISHKFSLDDSKGIPALYIFENSDINGFMVLSADDAVAPLLGYSDRGFIDPDNMPPALRYWLGEYAAQIQYARDFNLKPVLTRASDPLAGLPSIAPLVKTQWDQTAPYNDKCPLLNGVPTVTGCVATAMAQVMKYHNYPTTGQNRISYTWKKTGQTLTMNFGSTTFDWANMLDSYAGSFTNSQADAVALLMQAAGYSVEMNYDLSLSGTASGYVPGALINYFNYDKGVNLQSRSQYQYSDWAKLVYDNLNNVGPLIYDGTTLKESGHSFVCDGYLKDGYFHFNWGWSGLSDGYFLLDALSPSAQGTGGGDGGYIFLQDAIFGIQPPKGANNSPLQSQVVIYGSVEGEFYEGNLAISLTGSKYAGWAYQGVDQIQVNYGAQILPADNPGATPVYLTSTNPYNLKQWLIPGQYMPLDGENGYGESVSCRPTFSLSSLNLTKGVKYKVTNVYTEVNTTDWKPVMADIGCYNYFYITKTGNGTSVADYKIENEKQLELTCTSLSVETPLYCDVAVKVKATFENKSDYDFTQGITFVLLNTDGSERFTGDTFMVSIPAGGSITEEWVTPLTGPKVYMATELYPALKDPATTTIFYKATETVTMQRSPGQAVYTVSMKVDNPERMEGEVYVVANSTDFDVTAEVTCTQNIFSSEVNIWVAYSVGNNQYSPYQQYPQDIKIIDAGESDFFTANINFPSATPGNTYLLATVIDNSIKDMIQFSALSNGAGIEDVAEPGNQITFMHLRSAEKLYVKNAASVEIYALGGLKLAGSTNLNSDIEEIDLSDLGKGIVIVTATDNSGHRKSIKLAL